MSAPVAAALAIMLVLPMRAPGRSVPVVAASSPNRRSRFRSRFQAGLEAAVGRADLGHRVGQPLRAWLAAGVVGALFGLAVGGIGGGLVSAVVGLMAPPLVVVANRDRRARRVAALLPTELERLARGIRAGSTLTKGVLAAEHRGGPFGHAALMVRSGASIDDALRRWAASVEAPEAQLVRAVLTLGHESGEGQANAVQSVAAALRDRTDAKLDAAALASQARVSAVVLALVPIGVAALLVVADPSALGFYRSPAGIGLSGLGLGLNGVGLVWMRALARRVET